MVIQREVTYDFETLLNNELRCTKYKKNVNTKYYKNLTIRLRFWADVHEHKHTCITYLNRLNFKWCSSMEAQYRLLYIAVSQRKPFCDQSNLSSSNISLQ